MTRGALRSEFPRGVRVAIGEAWDRFWFRESDGVRLALVRIAFACAGLIYWLGHLGSVGALYADTLDFPLASARAWSSDWLPRVAMLGALSTVPAVTALWALYGLSWLALLLGWRTRMAAGLVWLLTSWFQLRNPTVLNAGDAVLRLTALYLAVSFLCIRPADRALSLERRRATHRGPGRVPTWTLRLLQIQVAVIYVVSGFWKLADPAWRGGEALWVALANPVFARFAPPPLAVHALFAGATLMVATWEFLFPLLVAVRSTRRPALLFGVSVHLFILIFLNTGIFPLAMLALYPAFMDPRTSGRLALWPRR